MISIRVKKKRWLYDTVEIPGLFEHFRQRRFGGQGSYNTFHCVFLTTNIRCRKYAIHCWPMMRKTPTGVEPLGVGGGGFMWQHHAWLVFGWGQKRRPQGIWVHAATDKSPTMQGIELNTNNPWQEMPNTRCHKEPWFSWILGTGCAMGENWTHGWRSTCT